HFITPISFFICFLLIVRRPLESTLFPSTTLFRSAQGAAVDSARVSLGYTLIRSPIEGRTGSLGVKVGGLVTANQTELMTIASGSDRKSTRLNSSHVAISYAVFCLKKKSCPVQHVT